MLIRMFPHIERHQLTYAGKENPALKRLLISTIELTTGRKRIQKLYNEIQDLDIDPSYIWDTALSKLDISVNYDEQQLAKIPESGPLIIIANHPYGVVDGLIMAALAAKARNKFSVLVNELLCDQDHRLDKFLLPIDFRETKDAIKTNIRTKQIALEKLMDGEALVIFPAGGVATSPKGLGKAEDLDWKRFTAKLIQMSKATVIPCYIPGQNSRLFQIVSQFSMTLRYGMLLHEVKNKIGRSIDINIADPIPYGALKTIKNRQHLLDHLRQIIFGLAVS